jgi:AcrR family transcriptional regulator
MARTPKLVEDRREQIMDAALRVFAKKGFARASNKDIAREAGITPGLIYHYFKSKYDLLRAVLEARSPLQLLESNAPQLRDLPPEAVLRAMSEQILRIADNENFGQLMRVYLSELLHNAKVLPMGTSMIQKAVTIIETYLTEMMEQGELRRADSGLVAHLLMGSIMDLVLRRQVLHDPITLQYSHQQIVDSLVSTTLQGLKPR